MGYRDESEALRARILTLESQLEEAQGGDEDDVESSVLASRSVFKKKVLRYSKSVDGHLSEEGVEAIRVALWTKLGAADPSDDVESAPGQTHLVHTRGHQVVRVTEAGGKTHLTIDHHQWGFGQSLIALIALAVALTVGMIAGGVHDDWTQMLMGAYAVAVVVLGPLAILNGWSRESASAGALKSMVRIATEDIATEDAAQPAPVKARVQADVVSAGEYEPIAEEVPEGNSLPAFGDEA